MGHCRCVHTSPVCGKLPFCFLPDWGESQADTPSRHECDHCVDSLLWCAACLGIADGVGTGPSSRPVFAPGLECLPARYRRIRINGEPGNHSLLVRGLCWRTGSAHACDIEEIIADVALAAPSNSGSDFGFESGACISFSDEYLCG